MEYIEGQPLRGPLSRQKSLEYAAQVLDALEAAHSRGVIHRDLKPANILLTANGIKLLDFGIARVHTTENAETTVSVSISAEHAVVGTPPYMAPEQIEGKPVDETSDIFAFGCVFYEMLTGKRAFDGRSWQEITAAVLACDERTFDELRNVWGPALQHIVRACLRTSRSDRWKAARDIRLALAAFDAAPVAAHPRSRTQLFVWIAIGLLVFGLSLCTYVLWQSRPQELDIGVFSVAPPENTTAIDTAAISPDGKFLALVAGTQLWIRPLDSALARAVASSTEAQTPFWAPDSSAVGFFSEGKLKRVAPQGGSPITLAEAPSGGGGAWSSDQFIIFAPSDNSRLYRVPAMGGQVARITELSAGQITHFAPRFLPNGRLLYSVWGSPEADGLYIAEIARDGTALSPRRLLRNGYVFDYVQTPDKDIYVLLVGAENTFAQRFRLPDSRFLGSPHPIVVPGQNAESRRIQSVSVSKNNIAVMNSRGPMASNVLWIDRAGEVKRILAPAGDNLNLALSPNQTRLIIARTQDSLDLWLHDVKRGTVSRFTSNPAADGVPFWSPDGSTIVFASWRDGSSNLYIKLANGSQPERLLFGSNTTKYPSDWSPDGRYIMFESSSLDTASDLWVLPTTPEGRAGQPEVYLNSEFAERDGRFSPDMRWVAYVSNETGREEAYVQSFPIGLQKSQISTNGGGKPVWKPDGRELYYVSTDGFMMAVPVTVGPNFAAGSPRKLFAVSVPVESLGQQYAPDNRAETFFIISRTHSEQRDNLHVVLNWRPEVR
jgi:eukaryotic-like serine/threonine-protein kinase